LSATEANRNAGQPVVTASPRSKIAKNLRELAGSLYPRPGAVARGVVGRSVSSMRLAWTAKGIRGGG
jgi:MinD-like ATPase involved in chromosome partitioning or flagellar assembly